jgi:hypothetical protein
MVKSIINGVSTYYPGRHYNLEVNGTTTVAQKNYTFGSITIAVRTDGVLKWVLSDHLPKGKPGCAPALKTHFHSAV